MAFTRKFLEAMGIEADKVDEIISAHSEVVNALKDQRDQYKADAEKLPSVQKELDDLKKLPNREEELKELQGKYDALDKEYKDFKTDIEVTKTKTAKEKAKRAALKEAGIADKYIDIVMKASAEDLEGLEIDKDGNLKNADKAKESYAKQFADFVADVSIKGADKNTPPASTGGTGKPTRAAELYQKHSAEMYGNTTSKEE